MEDLRIFVAIPCYGGNLKTSTLVGMLSLYKYCFQKKIGIKTQVIFNDALISRARNTLVAKFLDDDAFNGTHLLFIDSDIGFSEQNINRLIEKNEDMVCGVYPQKKLFWEKAVEACDNNPAIKIQPGLLMSSILRYNLNIDKKNKVEIINGFVSVDEAATGMLLIKRKVFDQMKQQYPDRKYPTKSTKIQMGYETNNLYDFFSVGFYKHKDGEDRYLSEDYFFSRLWRDMGGKIYADVLSPLTHSGNMDFTGSAISKFSKN